MSKPTGTGRVQELSRKNKASIRRKALLYNFDFDGDEIKLEHKIWLEDNIVPLLANPNLNITLRGLASRSGSAEYNKKLADRRIASVRQYLSLKGAKAGQFESFAAGESDAEVAGQADGTEDEKYRAVVITVVSTSSKTKVEFEKGFPTDKDNGFDHTATPRWLMVPFERPNREIRVVNAAGFFIQSRDEGIAVPESFIRSRPLSQINSDDEVIRINGRLPGKTIIDVMDFDGEVVGSLEVGVLPKLQVKLSFPYVRNPKVGTTRKLGEEHAHIREMNAIYLPQANIEFLHFTARDLPLTDDFGTEINESKVMTGGFTEWEVLTKNRNKSARISIFCVRELQQENEEGKEDDANALATIGGVDAVLEDDSSPNVGQTLAHECGHSLGVRHNSPITSTPDMLMLSSPDKTGRLIPKIHVDIMRSKVSVK